MVWRCVFQGGELVGIEQSSWHNGVGLVDTAKQGYWSNSWWANYCPDKWAIYPGEQTVCLDKLICKNFLKQTEKSFIAFNAYFSGQEFYGANS